MQRWEYGGLFMRPQAFGGSKWEFAFVAGFPAQRQVWAFDTATGTEVLGVCAGTFKPAPAAPTGSRQPSRDPELSVYGALDVLGDRGWIASPTTSPFGHFLRRERE